MLIPKFETRKELFDFLAANRDKIISHKRDTVKHSEAISNDCFLFIEKENAFKANMPVANPSDDLKVKVVINTTNLMDSHGDVHIPGIWKKSLSENKMLVFLQEHCMAFDKVIADDKDLKAYTEKIPWKDLGYKFEGITEALIFEATIRKARNPFMHDQYSKGYVRNHSVGMRYMDIVLCINDDEYGAEYEAWEKYYPYVANKDRADDAGYFWAVKQAKAIEGSAVVIGSNTATPTLDNNLKGETTETGAGDITTPKEQPQNTKKVIDYNYLLQNFNL